MKNKFSLIKIFIFLLFTVSLFYGWGVTGHKIINKKAVLSFPSGMNPFLYWRDSLTAHASDADIRKSVDPNEEPRHYINLDNYSEFINTGRIPQSLDSLVSIYGYTYVIDNGILPFSIIATFDSLKFYFQNHNWQSAMLKAADLGHYIGDGHNPLHLTRNYNGQYTNQTGVHSRYETSLIDRDSSYIIYGGDSIEYTNNINQFVFSFIYQNYPYVDSVLTADSIAHALAGYYNNTYYQYFWNLAGNFTIRLFKKASNFIASLIYTAWINAGSPLPAAGPNITYTPLVNTLSLSDRILTDFATITDQGTGIDTTTGTRPRIYYKKSIDANTFAGNLNTDNGWKWKEAEDNTSPFDFTIDYSILYGGSVFPGDTIQYFVIAQDLAAIPNVSINQGTFAVSPASVNLTATAFPLGGTVNKYVITVSYTSNITQTNFISVMVPQIMNCGTSTRLPVVFRAKVKNLIPNRLYRFYNQGIIYSDLGTTSSGAGNPMFVNPDSSTYRYTTSASLTASGGYDVFRTNSEGSYTRWFSIVNTGNTRFSAGNYIIPSIILGDSTGILLTRYALNDSIKVLNFSGNNSDTCATGIYGISVGFPRNIVSLYDNTSGTGKPLSQTYLETESVAVASLVPFYSSYVNGQNGRWGTIIPNANVNGIKRIEQRNIYTGNVMTFNTDDDGLWKSGSNTVNPSGGTTPVALLLTDAPLLNYPVLLSPPYGAAGQPVNLTFDWDTVSYASSYRMQLTKDSLFTSVVKDTIITTDSLYVSGLANNQTYWWKVAGITTTGTGPFCDAHKFTTATLSNVSLSLKAYLEGFRNEMTQVPDTVEVYLAISSSPYILVDSQTAVLSTSGITEVIFSNVSSDNYYIVLKHRNHLETWSALPQTFIAGIQLSYDFTTTQTQAYGNNLVYSNGTWCIFGGDINGDGFVDGADMAFLDNDLYNYVSGYVVTDINGDQFVDGADMAILDNNLYNYIGVVGPGNKDSIRRSILLNYKQERNKTIRTDYETK